MIYTTIQKFGVCKIFVMFLKEVSSSLKAWIYLIKNTVILWNIITMYNNCLLFYYTLKCNLFLWWQKYNLSSHYSSLQMKNIHLRNCMHHKTKILIFLFITHIIIIIIIIINTY